MSADNWIITSHTIKASHIRGFARGVRNEESSRLRLSVKQYAPKANQNPRSGDVTIIFSTGIGLGKETNEPFFDDLLAVYPRIRSIWGVDFAWNGESYILNEDVIGDEPSWVDVGRDLLQVVNTFQDDMPSPIFGMGYSFGCSGLTFASSMHPRLFSGLVLVEPIYGTGYREGQHKNHRAVWMAQRRESWPSFEAFREDFSKIPFYAAFDKRVFEKVIEHNIRDDPSKTEPYRVMLKTPKSMEVYTMMRTDATLPGYVSWPRAEVPTTIALIPGFYRPDKEPSIEGLPKLLPQVLLVWGQNSDLRRIPGYTNDVRDRIGYKPGGSGGKSAGAVSSVVVERCKHSVPYEQPQALAEQVAPWLKSQEKIWEQRKAQSSSEKNIFYTRELNPDWLERINKL